MLSIRLRQLRKENQEKQDDLAKLLQINRSTYGEYERGKIFPPIQKLQILAKHFNVSVDYLTGISNVRQNDGEEDPDDLNIILSKIVEDLHNNHTFLFKGDPINAKIRNVLIENLETTLKVVNLIES